MPANTSKPELTPEQKAEKFGAITTKPDRKKVKDRKPDEAPKKPGPSTGMKIAIEYSRSLLLFL